MQFERTYWWSFKNTQVGALQNNKSLFPAKFWVVKVFLRHAFFHPTDVRNLVCNIISVIGFKKLTCSDGCKYLLLILMDFLFNAPMWLSMYLIHCSRAVRSSQCMMPDDFPSTVRTSNALFRSLSVPSNKL